jgi:broad specificity phosphatase PhoE
LGIQQAKALSERFKNTKIDLICTSDLKRAVETVKIAFGDKSPIIVDKSVDKRLREINYGDFNGKPKDFIESMKKEHINEPFPNGESYKEAIDRVQNFYKELKEKYSDKIILIIRHRATHLWP